MQTIDKRHIAHNGRLFLIQDGGKLLDKSTVTIGKLMKHEPSSHTLEHAATLAAEVGEWIQLTGTIWGLHLWEGEWKFFEVID